MKNFKTFQLALNLYHEGQKLRLTSLIKNQFERASLSVVLNLAEGAGRISSKERQRFYTISLGSLREIQAILMILNHQLLLQKADVLGAHLYKLIQNPGSFFQNQKPVHLNPVKQETEISDPY